MHPHYDNPGNVSKESLCSGNWSENVLKNWKFSDIVRLNVIVYCLKAKHDMSVVEQCSLSPDDFTFFFYATHSKCEGH